MDGDRITTREFYQAQLETNDRVASIETTLEQYHGAVLTAIARLEEQDKAAQERKDDNTYAHEKFEDRLHKVETSDKRWTGINGVLSAVIAGFIGWWTSHQ